MTTYLRLISLVLVLTYSLVFGPGTGLAGQRQAGWFKTHWLKAHPLKSHRVHAPRVDTRNELGVKAVKYARRLLGVPYRYGGDSPASGFDCSGFVRFVLGHFGLDLPHSSYADFNLGTKVPRSSLLPGDLVFFDGVGHVGLYIGSGHFIHAPHTGTRVQISSLSDPWYQSSYDGARRVLRAAATRARSSRVDTRRLASALRLAKQPDGRVAG